jgi:hypothetical protein
MENLERRKGKKKRFFLSTLRLIFDRSARVRFTTNKTRRLTLTQLTSVTVLTGLVVCHGARGTVTLAIYPKNHRDQKSLFTYFNNFKPLLLRSIKQNVFFFFYIIFIDTLKEISNSQKKLKLDRKKSTTSPERMGSLPLTIGIEGKGEG